MRNSDEKVREKVRREKNGEGVREPPPPPKKKKRLKERKKEREREREREKERERERERGGGTKRTARVKFAKKEGLIEKK